MTWDDIKESPPLTFAGWDAKIRESAIHNKWSPQLNEMTAEWQNKIPKLEYLLSKEQASSNTKVVKNIDGTFETVDRTQERLDNIATLQTKIKRGHAIIELCKQEERIRVVLEAEGQVFDVPDKYKRDGKRIDVSNEPALTLPRRINRQPIGTTYYIDSDNGNDGNAGTSTGAAWATLSQFVTNAATAAGDIAILRNSMTANYGTGILGFQDNGTINNPIVLKRDYNNAFSDDVDLSGTATATLTNGSKTVTYASDISSVLSAGDWIYADGDDPEEYAYEVESVSTVTATLYLPYLGGQAGSGKTTTNIGSAPQYGSTSTSDGFAISGDDYWEVRGLRLNSNYNSGVVAYSNATGLLMKDIIFESGSGTLTEFFLTSAECSNVKFEKCRALNFAFGFSIADDPISGYMKNCLLDGNSKSGSYGLYLDGSSDFTFDQCEFKNHAAGDIGYFPETTGYKLRNCILSSTTKFAIGGVRERFLYMEDFNGTPSKTTVYVAGDGANDDIGWESDTTTVRSGGSNISIKVTPADNIDTWELLNIPIYHDTSSKTYTVYVKSNATANWTADPTASELELAFEAWGHATNDYRIVTKSTDVVDFNGVTTWEALAVTVTAGQAGVGYLTLKYRKPKEASVSNEFYVDPLVVIS